MEPGNKIFAEIRQLDGFTKDFKKLLKKYRTLPDDLIIFIETQLQLYHKFKKDNQGVERIPNLGFTMPLIYKGTKFACRSLRGTASDSGIRVIYAYYEDKDIIELIEIYYKGDKAREDLERIMRHYKLPSRV